MNGPELDALRSQLVLHEGLRLKVYDDSLGIPTIGVGRNLRDKGISQDEATALLNSDINECLSDLHTFAWFMGLDSVRQRALIDLRFNLGPSRFRGFRNMIAALEHGDPVTAAAHLQDSAWFSQVGQRGPRLVKMLGDGTD